MDTVSRCMPVKDRAVHGPSVLELLIEKPKVLATGPNVAKAVGVEVFGSTKMKSST